jgi:hypothetical protein
MGGRGNGGVSMMEKKGYCVKRLKGKGKCEVGRKGDGGKKWEGGGHHDMVIIS